VSSFCPPPSSSQGSTKVVLSDIPSSMNMASLEAEIARFGTVVNSTSEEMTTTTTAKRRPSTTKAAGEDGVGEEADGGGGGDQEEEEEHEESLTKILTVSYASREQAEEAVKGLNDAEFEGVRLQVKLVVVAAAAAVVVAPPADPSISNFTFRQGYWRDAAPSAH
jgi:hypothetical protein